jgi:hypothetical protein
VSYFLPGWRLFSYSVENASAACALRMQEPAITELADGRLMMLCRTGRGRHYTCHSSDGGDTWAPADTGLSGTATLFLALDPTSPVTLYLGTQDGFFKTSNGGASWSSFGLGASEALQIAQHMWSGNLAPYQGRYYQLAEPINSPQPLSRPHPPIMVGGSGEKKTLRLVAQYADACNLFVGAGMGQIAHKLDVLKRHSEALGRPYDEIERTILLSSEQDGCNLAVREVAYC